MNVQQIYSLVNDIAGEVTGQENLLNEDLTNIVDVGTEIMNANQVDNFCKKLVDRIGKEVYADRKFAVNIPKIVKDKWEYGSVMMKTRCKPFSAVENASWKLIKGTTPNQFEFNPPDVEVKFFNSKTTFEVDVSIAEIQLKESFTNATTMNSFISMIFNTIENSLTLYTNNMCMRVITNAIGSKIQENNGVVDLLTLYNTENDTTLTSENALSNKDFMKYASYVISLYVERLQKPTTLYNVDDFVNCTPSDDLHVVFLDRFAKASEIYLESDTYHNELVKLPNYETIPFWQGSGKTYSYTDCSQINITTADGDDVNKKDIIGVMFDTRAMGVCNDNKRVTSSHNAKGEFYNYFYKCDCSYFNDLAENIVVFMLGNGTISST